MGKIEVLVVDRPMYRTIDRQVRLEYATDTLD